MKYVILGNGWIGNYLQDKLNGYIYMEPQKIRDQRDADYIIDDFAREDSVFINCIGKTGRPNIDWCEDHKQETIFSNILVPFYIAEACRRLGRYWIHIGSGCVYDGYEKIWTEEDAPNYYGSFYSVTKAISQDILKSYKEVCVLRIRMPIDKEMSERSYVFKLLKYIKESKSLFDMKNSMTYLPDLVAAIDVLAHKRITGIFNMVNPGPLLASEILKLYDPNLKFKIEEYQVVRNRLKAGRCNCILSSKKLLSYVKIHTLESRIKEGLSWQKDIA